jgi:hypothetical protein
VKATPRFRALQHTEIVIVFCGMCLRPQFISLASMTVGVRRPCRSMASFGRDELGRDYSAGRV